MDAFHTDTPDGGRIVSSVEWAVIENCVDVNF